jgi:hypothetical protein
MASARRSTAIRAFLPLSARSRARRVLAAFIRPDVKTGGVSGSGIDEFEWGGGFFFEFVITDYHLLSFFAVLGMVRRLEEVASGTCTFELLRQKALRRLPATYDNMRLTADN